MRLTKRRVALVLGGLGGACVLGFTGFALAGSITVTLTNTGPQPATATVELGETVLFVGEGNQNHAIFAPGFTVPFIQPGETHPVRMVTPGKVPYQATGFYSPRRGVIVVTVPSGLALSASKISVAYRQPVTLSGTSPLENYEVGLEAKASGRGVRATWTRVATVPTAADGSFSTIVYPEIGTSYRVTLGRKTRSQPVRVSVGPLLSISVTPRAPKAGAHLRVVAKVVPASAATELTLVRYGHNRKRPVWRDVMQETVPASGTVVFNWPVTAGRTLLRVQTSRATAAPGFTSATSGYIVVNGNGTKKAP